MNILSTGLDLRIFESITAHTARVVAGMLYKVHQFYFLFVYNLLIVHIASPGWTFATP